MSERDAFGPSLKAERDRCGITLQAIADSTKIGVSLLAALERNDLSRWPKGIFRRAFVREYVTALGLPPEPIVAEFVRLFPDETCPEIPPAIPPAT
jgi:cytoskeletal protein RodZ